MIKFKPKAYFTDLDGTLLDLPKTKEGISLDNLNIVKEKNQSGTPFIIATGRFASEYVLDLAQKTEAPYVICQNGGLIVNNKGDVIVKHEIKKDTVMEITEVLKENKLFIIYNSGNTIYGTSTKLKVFRP
ncbi:putative hydrolase [Mycoplasmopsis arginini]|nr:putative hydrolase [Chlamydia abortus]SGA24053.1 putative hydrolase [Mycoplasmopsis arginini]SGA26726.1 putative hydrolase [Mycoplasmopsis arginini]SGA33147.1 putative hydrolase [Chlamydia abortus]